MEPSTSTDPITEVKEAASSGSSERQSQSQIFQPMNPDLYDAAAKGNVQGLEEKDPQQHDLERVLTLLKDTPGNPASEVNKAPTIGSSQMQSQPQIIQPMDADSYKAASEGNFKPLEEKYPHEHDLKQIVTHFNDTILHIHIKFQKKRGQTSTEFVEKVLDKCPSLLFQANTKGDTPLHVAAKGGCSHIVEVLIQRAKQQPDDQESKLRADSHMLRMTNHEDNTPLHEAVIHRRFKVVEILTKADHDFPYEANKYGKTPLYLAAEASSLEMVKTILDSCESAAHEGPNRKTALHVAAALDCDYEDITEYLLEKKKSLCLTKATDEYGWTPLHYAAYEGNSDVAKQLLKEDRSTAYIVDNDRKMTALHMAASQGHSLIVKEIISQCPECCEMVDGRDQNLLHFAVLTFTKKELDDLLENPLVRSLINEKDANGNTPYHVYAAAYRQPLSYSIGANIHALNHKNVSVINIVVSGHSALEKEIQALFKDVGEGGRYQRGVLSKRNEENHYRNEEARRKKYKEGLKKTIESHSLVATLIATVTFAAAFTVPGGYHSDENDVHEKGTAILSRNSAFQAFIITDAIAMTLSLSAVFTHFIMSFEKIVVGQHGRSVILAYEKFFNLASCLTMLAIVAVVVAFVTGLYAVLVPSLWLAITTCCIGLSFFLLVFVALKLFWRDLRDWLLEILKNLRRNLASKCQYAKWRCGYMKRRLVRKWRYSINYFRNVFEKESNL